MAPSNMQVETMETMASPPQRRKGMSIWWPMGFLIAWVLFSALGGGLFAGGVASAAYSCDDDGYCYESDGDSGMAIGGIACLALSGILGLLFWVTFIIWLVKRRSSNNHTVVYVNNAHSAAPAPAAHQPVAAAPYQVEPLGGVYAEPQYTSDKPGRHCAQCGMVGTTPFCPQCGARV